MKNKLLLGGNTNYERTTDFFLEKFNKIFKNVRDKVTNKILETQLPDEYNNMVINFQWQIISRLEHHF